MSDDISLTDSILSSGFKPETLSVLYGLGRRFTPNTEPLYVVHTSTIPLASIVVRTYNNFEELHHGKLRDHCSCSRENCMFAPKKKSRQPECVSKTCPCLQRDLIPLCFLEAHKRMCDPLDDSARVIEPDEISYCPNAISIFDHKLPLNEQEGARIRSWDLIKQPEQIADALDLLYWFKKFKSKSMKRNILALARNGIRRAKEVIKQIIHTLDGLIVKKILAFGKYLPDYREIAEQTAILFGEMLSDSLIEYDSVDPKTTYGELKPFFKAVKQTFVSEDEETRTLFLLHKFNSNGLNRFFAREFRGVSNEVVEHRVEGFEFTETLRWIYRMQYMTQTRNLGHLPECEALYAIDKYLEFAGRPPEPGDIETEKFLYLSVKRSLLRSQRGAFSKHEAEIYGAIDEPIVPSASVDQTRSSGGKPEDLRMFLTELMGTEYPVKDLDTGEVKEIRTVSSDPSDYKAEAFWLSLNELDKAMRENNLDMFDGVYVGINEPGKLRSLIKLKSILGWALTPAHKMCAEILSWDPMHFQGFKGSSHGWSYFRRLKADSGEAAFMYNGEGLTKDNIRQVFQDWTQATDGIPKRKGIAMLKGFFDGVGFPTWYGRIVLWAISRPLRIKARVLRLLESERVEHECNVVMSEGFPMGMPMTKIVLHLCHSCTREISSSILKSEGLKVSANKYDPPQRGTKYAKSLADATVWSTGMY